MGILVVVRRVENENPLMPRNPGRCSGRYPRSNREFTRSQRNGLDTGSKAWEGFDIKVGGNGVIHGSMHTPEADKQDRIALGRGRQQSLYRTVSWSSKIPDALSISHLPRKDLPEGGPCVVEVCTAPKWYGCS